MAAGCFYCGGTAVARDYAIPVWAPALAGLAGAPVEHVRAVEPEPGEPAAPADRIPLSVPSHPALGEAAPGALARRAAQEATTDTTTLEPAQYAATTLCQSCAVWVDEVDARVIPLVEAMIRGEPRTYDADEQSALALWGARAAFAILAVERKRQGVPKRHRLELREGEQPSEHTFVGLGRYEPNHIGLLAARMALPVGVEAYNVVAVLGHLVLKVFGVASPTVDTRTRPPAGRLVQVWPSGDDTVSWPPLWSYDERTLERAFLSEPLELTVR